MSHAIGIDVGGASARVGLVSSAGRVLYHDSFRTGIAITGAQLMRSLLRRCRAALRLARGRRLSLSGIGIAMPAFVDDHARVTGASNLPGLNGLPVGRLLERQFRLPVRMENDVSAAAFGEYNFGDHRGSSRRLLFVAVGTGIGAGMIVDGELLRVSRGCLGDPGHIIVDVSGCSPCRCGGNGCLEAVASGWALVEAARRVGIRATPKQVFARARAGHRALRELVERTAVFAGIGLATLCVILNPDTIVLGGGVALDAGEPFRRTVNRVLHAHAVPFFVRGVRLSLARSGRHAGLLGAASIVLFDLLKGNPGPRGLVLPSEPLSRPIHKFP